MSTIGSPVYRTLKHFRFSKWMPVAAFDIEQSIIYQVLDSYHIRWKVKHYWYKPGHPYVAIIFYFPKKYKDRLRSIMDEVANKIIVCGYSDYYEFCQHFFNSELKEGSE